jgi:hypothetical protein
MRIRRVRSSRVVLIPRRWCQGVPMVNRRDALRLGMSASGHLGDLQADMSWSISRCSDESSEGQHHLATLPDLNPRRDSGSGDSIQANAAQPSPREFVQSGVGAAGCTTGLAASQPS